MLHLSKDKTIEAVRTIMIAAKMKCETKFPIGEKDRKQEKGWQDSSVDSMAACGSEGPRFKPQLRTKNGKLKHVCFFR